MRSLLAVLVLLTGCNLYFGGDDEPPCLDYAYLSLAEDLRNPYTGLCEYGGQYPCDSVCGPCPLAESQKDWGSCYSACEGLAENTCITTAGCLAAYQNNPADDGGFQYWGCWATAPSGPIQGGACAGLDAQQCSRHDDCSAYYDNYLALDQAVPSEFNKCAAEKLVGPLCESDTDCGPSERCTAGEEECLGCAGQPNADCAAVCQGHCVPKSSCANVTCETGSHCEEQCSQGACGPVCVPDVDACTAIDCGPGYECVQVCTPNTPTDPGVCKSECKPLDACEALATEAACTARPDCVPVYEGEDCTCYPGHCECNILTYERCETN